MSRIRKSALAVIAATMVASMSIGTVAATADAAPKKGSKAILRAIL